MLDNVFMTSLDQGKIFLDSGESIKLVLDDSTKDDVSYLLGRHPVFNHLPEDLS